MRKQHKQKQRKQLNSKKSHKEQSAVAAGLVAGGMSALMLTALPASAETPYRDALDKCVTAPPARETLAECVANITVPKPGAVVKPAAAAPAAIPVRTVAPDDGAVGLSGSVTSGADEVKAVSSESPPVVAADLPDAPSLQRRIEVEAARNVESVDASVNRALSGQASDDAAVSDAPASDDAGSDEPQREAPAEQHPSSDAAPVSDWMSGALSRLRQCESNGNYGTNTGNGYYGAYQFSPRTWQSLGFEGYPHQASPGVQDEAAIALQARDGWGQWPACARRLDLL